MTLLEVTDLTVSSPTADGEVKPVRGVSFSVDAGRTLGLINLPSGCKFDPRCGYVLYRCLTEEPSLRPLGLDAYHSSACWLPVKAAGLSEQAEELRAQMVREGRGEAAAEVFEAEVAGAFASNGSVAG